MSVCRAFFVLAVASLPSMAFAQDDLNGSNRDWRHFFISDSEIFFLDQKSIKRTGDQSEIDLLLVLKDVEEKEPGFKVDHVFQSYTVSCSQRTYRRHNINYKYKNELRPPAIELIRGEGETPPAPDSFLGKVFGVACGDFKLTGERVAKPYESARKSFGN